MSHPLLPKNKNRDNALFRQGKPDFSKLEAAAFPTPTVDEKSAILENTDTGDRYRWTGTDWFKIEIKSRSMPFDFFLEMSKGNIPGHTARNIIGRNPTVGTSVEDLWDPGGVLVYATAGEQWEISSDDANDTSAGTGARTVIIRYLDDNHVRQTETVTLNGFSVVTTVGTDMFRFESAEVITAGSGAENAGLLTITVAGAGDVRGAIIANENVSLDGHYTVPAGKTAFAVSISEEINKGEDILLKYKATRGTNGIFRTVIISTLYQSSVFFPIIAVKDPLVEKSDLKITAVSTNPASTPSVVIGIIEVDN